MSKQKVSGPAQKNSVFLPGFLFLASALVLVLISGKAFAENVLYENISMRLNLMKEVASYKWVHEIPIESKEREEKVLMSSIKSGLEHRIKTESVTSIFVAQFEAAKEIQRCWHRNWEREGPPAYSTDLMENIRPRIENIGRKIIQLLPEHVANINEFLSYMEIKCLSEKAKHNIFQKLANVDFYVSAFEQVTKSGILRVGTTGDYEPFSIKDATEKEPVIKGIDADLAKSLATELSVKLVFMDTTWPEIMRDLKKNKFDVAMSGISITAERETLAYFSEPYHTGGKIPVSLCSKAQHYSSLKKIDQKGVRVVVNPGGTNEEFLDKNIKHAGKIIYPDNKTIFMEIIEGRADVMITDQIEASVQTEKNRALCTTQVKPLNLQKKGILIHQDKDLRNAVNKWLRSVRHSGYL